MAKTAFRGVEFTVKDAHDDICTLTIWPTPAVEIDNPPPKEGDITIAIMPKNRMTEDWLETAVDLSLDQAEIIAETLKVFVRSLRKEQADFLG